MVERIKATVHAGPKGGVEFRLWSSEDTYRVVGKYKALPHMDEAEKAKAETMELARNEAKRSKSENDATWRGIMSGRTV